MNLRTGVYSAENAAWQAYLKAGSMREAARALGVHEVTVRKRIAALRDVHGVHTNAQLADALARATKVVAT